MVQLIQVRPGLLGSILTGGLLLRPDEVIDRADTSGLRPYRSTRVTARGIAQMKATLVEAVQAQGFVRPWTDLDKVCFENLLW
jgi:hypothetical protein